MHGWNQASRDTCQLASILSVEHLIGVKPHDPVRSSKPCSPARLRGSAGSSALSSASPLMMSISSSNSAASAFAASASSAGPMSSAGVFDQVAHEIRRVRGALGPPAIGLLRPYELGGGARRFAIAREAVRAERPTDGVPRRQLRFRFGGRAGICLRAGAAAGPRGATQILAGIAADDAGQNAARRAVAPGQETKLTRLGGKAAAFDPAAGRGGGAFQPRGQRGLGHQGQRQRSGDGTSAERQRQATNSLDGCAAWRETAAEERFLAALAARGDSP